MAFTVRILVGLIGIHAMALPSCGRREATAKLVPPVQLSPAGAASRSSFGDTGLLSTDDLIQKIINCDLRQGYTGDYEKAAKDLIGRDPKLALRTLYNAGTITSMVGFDDLCKILASSDTDLLIGWLRNDLPRLASNDLVAAMYWTSMLRAMVVVDSGKALETLQSSGLKQNQKREAVTGMFYALSKSDTGKALTLAEQLPPGLRDKGYEGIGYSFVESDPARAFQIASLIRNSSDRGGLLAGTFVQWVKVNSEEAFREIEKLDPSQFVKIGLASTDYDRLFLKTLVEKKPEVLQNFLLRITPGFGNKKLFETSADLLAATNFEAAFTTVRDVPAGELRNELTELIFATGVKPANAAEYVRMAESLEGEAGLRAITGLGRSFGGRSLDEIMAVSAGINEASQSKFLLAAFNNYRLTHPDEMMEKITMRAFQGKLTPEDSKTLTEDFAVTLAINDADRAVSWYEQLPQTGKLEAMEGLARGMAGDDIDRLGDWLNSKERNAEWAIGASVMIRHLEYTDSEAAAVWKKALADSEELRRQP